MGGRKIPAIFLNLALIPATLLLCVTGFEIALRVFSISQPSSSHPLKVDPDNRIALIPNSQELYHTSEFTFTVSANKFGRRDHEWSSEQIQDPENIVFIGDSFVMGYGVSDQDTIPSLLETLFGEHGKHLEVFNFGIGGSVALPEYKALLEKALHMGIKARTVLVGIFLGNDFSEVGQPATKSRLPDNGPAPHDEAVLRSEMSLVNFLHHLRIFYFFRDNISSSPQLVALMLRIGNLLNVKTYDSSAAFLFQKTYPDALLKQLNGYLSYLTQMRWMCDKLGYSISFVLFPNKIQVENYADLKVLDTTDPESPNKLILSFCKAHGLSCLDTLPILLDARKSEPGTILYFPEDRHFTPRGNQLSAKKIYRFLQMK